MNITHTTFQYDFNSLKKDIAYYINDDKKIDIFIDSIRDNILYGAFTSRDLINSNYDFSISLKVIEMLESKLEGKKIFNKETFEVLKNKAFIGVEVDNEDYDTSETYCENTFEVNDIDVQLYPTFPTFDFYSNEIDELFDNVEDYESFKWELYAVVEKFERHYIDRYLQHSEYQYGGNLVHAIQREYDNLIGMYNGGWGDCGAVYVFVNKNSVVSTVDMY